MKYTLTALVSHYDFFRELATKTGVADYDLIDAFSVNDSGIEEGEWAIQGDSQYYFLEAIGSEGNEQLALAAAELATQYQEISGMDAITFTSH